MVTVNMLQLLLHKYATKNKGLVIEVLTS